MARPDYAQAFAEQIWVVNETTFNTQAYPAVTDAVIPLPGASLPSVLVERVPSQERQQTQGVRGTISRKKIPSTWTLPLYAKYGTAAGTPPSWGLLAKKVFGVETITGGVSVVYTELQNIAEQTVTIWHWLDNLMRGQRGGLVNTLRQEYTGTDEPRLTFGGYALNEVLAGTTTLNGAIDAIVTSIVVADSTRYQIGPATTDRVRIQIDTEVLEITAIDYATHTLTVLRAQAGSVAAAHSNGASVDPWKPGADTDPADTIAPLTLGLVDLGAPLTDARIISVSNLLDRGMAPRLTEYAQGVSTGYRQDNPRTVTGELKLYLRQVNQSILTDLGRDLERAVTIHSGSVGTARLRASMPKLKFLTDQIAAEDSEFGITAPYQAFESTTGLDELTLTLD